MADQANELAGFAYGEDLEEGSGRSLGYRLLAPMPPTKWCAEVEALARRLQAAPYPENWPGTDLFCSVLLVDGRRVVALARYGLSDHTSGQRRGGLELIGVLTAGELSVGSALALYQWLKQRRLAEDDLRRLGGTFRTAEVLGATPAATQAGTGTGPVPVLPVRLWQEGGFLFAAATPADPDHHLRLLELAVTPQWQWLPLVGPDFPLPAYAQRGPLIAWTPHLAGVALKLERRDTQMSLPRRPRTAAVLLGLMLVGLLVGNLWYMHQLRQAIAALPAPAPAPVERPLDRPEPPARPVDDDSRERFARALYDLIVQRDGLREWKEQRPVLLERYDGLARKHSDLRVRADNEPGKLAVAATAVLAARSADRIEETVRRALTGKGFSDRLIQAACAHVREEFSSPTRPHNDGR